MSEQAQLAKLIRKFRGEMTQEELAEKFGVTRQLVYLWEHGLSKPNAQHMAAMGIKTEYHVRKK